jgi:hypothetical protein
VELRDSIPHDDRTAGSYQEIILRGSLGGRMPLGRASLSLSLLARACVEPAQRLYGDYRNRLVVHGKEKVYGSIP